MVQHSSTPGRKTMQDDKTEEVCSICQLPRKNCLEHFGLRPGAATGGVFLGANPRLNDVDLTVTRAIAKTK